MKYSKDNPNTIQNLFGSIAPQYDRANAILSVGLHYGWNRRLIKETLSHLTDKQSTYLDLCCGTGDISFCALEYAKKHKHSFHKMHLLDFCSEMLSLAKHKAELADVQSNIFNYIQGDAQKIPLPDKSVDFVTIAYGIRNVTNPESCIQEAARVLRPNGRFGILELTRPKITILKFFHSIYLKTLLPVLGRLVTQNQNAYHYLANSVQTFIPPEQLEQAMRKNNFTKIKKISLTGGIATVIIGNQI